jgi:hypothetical protein
MIRYALLLCAGLLTAVCFACVQTTAPLPAAGGGNRLFAACANGSGDPGPFLNKVYTLSSSYIPSNMNGYSPPSPIGVPVANPPTPSAFLAQITTDLGAAYCAASSTFKKQLDALTAVFITCADQTNCAPSSQNVFTNSWGYRENALDQSVLQRTYVALSADLWNGGNLQLYSSFETSLYFSLLNSGQASPVDLPITIQATDTTGADSKTLTALAAL